MTIRLPLVAVSSLAIASAASASLTTADYLGSSGLEGMGAFTAAVTYDYSGGATASLTLELTNTTSAAFGGYITAIALSTGNSTVVSSMTGASSSAFQSLGSSVSASPFGTYQLGASTGNSWTGGGAPQGGLGIGQSATFSFLVSGSAANLASLTAGSAFSPQSSLGSGLAVRFRGMDNGGSDKVLGFVPGPGGLTALAFGVACGRRRRRC